MTPSLSAHIDPQTIVCQGMLLTKRIKKQFSRVPGAGWGNAGEGGERIARVGVKVFAGKGKKKTVWCLRTTLHL